MSKLILENGWQIEAAENVNWDKVKEFIEAGTWVASNTANTYSQVFVRPEMRVDFTAIPEPTPTQIAEVLEAAADLFESEKLEWIQGEEVRSKPGHPGTITHACAIGALSRIRMSGGNEIRWDNETLYRAAVRAVVERLGGASIPGWNDKEGRTVGEVIDLFKTVAKDLRNQDNGQ